nr:hypothetical protein [Tanacetum cinerariifolium]
MTSLSKKYKRLNQIPGKLRINPTLPPVEQVPSLSSGRKRKALELEPKVCIASLECNRSLPEGIPFVNNKEVQNVVKEDPTLNKKVLEAAEQLLRMIILPSGLSPLSPWPEVLVLGLRTLRLPSRENSAHHATISPIVPSPEPSRPKGEKDYMITEEQKEEKVHEEEPEALNLNQSKLSSHQLSIPKHQSHMEEESLSYQHS